MFNARRAAILALGWVASLAVMAAEPTPKAPIITDPVYTAPVKLVDVGGGRRINLYCRGSGSPTVIFDSGLSDSSIAWALVQPRISERNRTCSYDRAGLAFSDAATRPSTAANDVDDIRKALAAEHIGPPYLLVGHSAAALAVRVFADRYRDEVVGMVIVDGSHEDQVKIARSRATPKELAEWDKDAKDSTCMDALKAGHGEIPKASPAYKQCVGEPDARLSDALNAAQLGYSARGNYQMAVASEYANFSTVSADQARATRKDFGDMPIIVLTSSRHPVRKNESTQRRNQSILDWEGMHNEIAAMSTHGINEIVPRAGHIINYDRPEIVIDAIRQALAIAAEQSAGSGDARLGTTGITSSPAIGCSCK